MQVDLALKTQGLDQYRNCVAAGLFFSRGEQLLQAPAACRRGIKRVYCQGIERIERRRESQ